MHLIISIALGIFAGLWLFTRWLEWREAWWERRELRQIERAERQAERERATAEYEAKLAREAAEYDAKLARERASRPPRQPLIKSGPWLGFAVFSGWVLVLVVLGLGI